MYPAHRSSIYFSSLRTVELCIFSLSYERRTQKSIPYLNPHLMCIAKTCGEVFECLYFCFSCGFSCEISGEKVKNQMNLNNLSCKKNAIIFDLRMIYPISRENSELHKDLQYKQKTQLCQISHNFTCPKHTP